VSNSTVTSSADHQNCSITLYDKEYHSGQSLVVTRSIPDLSLHKFEDKLVSVKVEGNCRWKIFSEKNFAGYKKRFTEANNYSMRSKVGNLFLNAKSVKKL